MDESEFKHRSQQLAVRVIKLAGTLSRDATAQALAGQLLRSGTAIGVRYRMACREKSRADYAAKMNYVAEAAEETVYWLELLAESGLVKASLLGALLQDTQAVLEEVVSESATGEHTGGQSADFKL